MTAIAGYWAFNNRGGADRTCLRMLDAQALYGPHDRSSWSAGNCSLGRALFRTLPEDDHDFGPVVGGAGKLVLVADLRLDNREELIGALGIAYERARASSDASILMSCLERWDESAVERLVGDFAFALWNSETRRLLLARDFLGQRPLHYHQGKDFFAFASMPKGLHALEEVPRGPNPKAVTDFLMGVESPGEATFFDQIAKVPPGHILSIGFEGLVSRRYWIPPAGGQRLASAGEYEEALRGMLDAAVSARLRVPGGRVGAHLSGGLDSSAVAASAAKLLAFSGGELFAFTSVPRDVVPEAPTSAIADEGPLAAATAALHPNMRHVLIRSERSALDGLHRDFFLYERPMPNPCNGVWWDDINDSAKEKGAGVILTGAMGNLSLSYSGMELLPELLAEGRLLRLSNVVRSLRRNGSRYGTIVAQLLGPFLPHTAWGAVARLRRGSFTGMASPSAAEAEASGTPQPDLSGRPKPNSYSARWHALRHVDVGNYNKGVLGGWGIDVRDPTADRRLVEFCFRVPADHFLQDGVPRSLARRAFADRVPAAVLDERRKGMQSADWFDALSSARSQLREEVDLIRRCPAAAEILNTEQMLRRVEEWPTSAAAPDLYRRYRVELLRAVSAGHFVRRAVEPDQ